MFGFQQNSFSITDIVGLIGLIFAILALIFTAIQLRQNNVARKAQVMMTIVERYFNNPDERKMYYKLDYNQWKFDPNNFIGTDEERWLDGILYNFHLVGGLLRIGAISVEEIRLLDFEVHRVLSNPEVKKYLAWLDEEVKANRISSEPFRDVNYLAEKLFENESLIRRK